jgi:hypothetical protein
MSSILCHALIQKKLHLPREMHGEILDFLLPKHLQKDNEYIKKYNKVLKELPKFELSHIVDSDAALSDNRRNPKTYFSPFIIIQSNFLKKSYVKNVTFKKVTTKGVTFKKVTTKGVTFKKVTTKGRKAPGVGGVSPPSESPGVGGVSPPLDEKNIKFIYQVNRDTFSYYANITTYLTSSSIKLTLKNIDYELEKENERILDYRVNKYDNGIEKKSRLSLVKHYDDYYKNQLHNNRDRAREIEKRIYKRLLCIK